MKKFIIPCMMSLLFVSCGHKTYNPVENVSPRGNTHVAVGYGDNTTQKSDSKVKVGERKGLTQVAVIPNATAFKMNGNYSHNVAVTLNQDGKLLYFPAPSDITADSEPIDLGNGWWLNCQGFGPNSVFLKYTFAEYAALPEAPSPQQLKLDIIPGSKVTQYVELPMRLNQAVNNLEEVRECLK